MSSPLPPAPPGDSLDTRIDTRDRAAREWAVDPTQNVALEASAGTGKTRVLVDRYVNLLRAGVDPSNVLAMTFTRKAAAEMRERIVSALRAEAVRGAIAPARWRELRDRVGDIAVSTIDAFCLSLLREFPLEADLDPGFMMADEADVPRLVNQALDTTLRTCRAAARHDEDVALVFAQLGERRLRRALVGLLNRRIGTLDTLQRYLLSGPSDLSVSTACGRGAATLQAIFDAIPRGLDGFLDSGPLHPRFSLLAQDLRRVLAASSEELSDERRIQTWKLEPGIWTRALSYTSEHFLTRDGQPRKQLSYARTDFASERDWRRHREIVVTHARAVARLIHAYRHDLNRLTARGVWRLLQIAVAEYRRTLDANAVLDFPELLLRTLHLLHQMDEFARSRYRLESRYHHILVDECQDTSRAQWELVSLLVRSWGEGAGLAHSGPLHPSIFVVGDPKQSIYGFRGADASVLDEAARFLEGLRPGGDVRRSISRNFRAIPALLAFVNDLCADVDKATSRRDAFRYDERDRFPTSVSTAPERSRTLGIAAADSAEQCAERVATEIEGLLARAMVRDRETGMSRPARPSDVAILFRVRESHREYQEALEQRGIPTYVYKGLGLFDADEVKDVIALLSYLSDPCSDMRAAGLLRSRFVRLSDEGLRLLAPNLAEALCSADRPSACAVMDSHDRRVMDQVRGSTALWRSLVDRMPPAELLDRILCESAYEIELRGHRLRQARENLKKMQALVRRIQNRGYATIGRIVEHIECLSDGDESSAVVDAVDAVHLMTVHAAKGLEFPVIFLVNLARGTGNRREPIRVSTQAGGEEGSVSVGDFQSDADQDAAFKDCEETKRLLYVSVTRARDRLYFASVVKDGRLQAGRGSLAEVLPPTFANLFARAAEPGADILTWQAASGARHEFHVCACGTAPSISAAAADAPHVTDLEGLVTPGPTRRSVVEEAGDSAAHVETTALGRRSDRLVGILVHRLIDRLGLNADIADSALAQSLFAVSKAEDAAEGADIAGICARALEYYRNASRQADLAEVIASGVGFHEVPFTHRVGGTLLRGTIDCVVQTPTGEITVLEFKTGRPRREDREQLQIYRRAVLDMFPGRAVNALLVYPDHPTILQAQESLFGA